MRPGASDIVGIAFSVDEDSEDLLYLDARAWTQEDQRAAEELQRDTGFLQKTEIMSGTHMEYPSNPEFGPVPRRPQKGSDRNKLCFCNSGLKYKRCHGR